MTNMPKITTRTDDVMLKAKLRKIARKNGRSLSRETEHILKLYVEYYEQKNGEIKIDK